MIVLYLALALSHGALLQVENGVRLSLQEALDLAVDQNFDIKTARAQLEEAEALRKSARGRFGPVLRTEANIIEWDSQVVAQSLGGPSVPPEFQDFFQPFLVREQTTGQVVTSLNQPLTQLYSIYKGYQAARQTREASREEFSRTRRQVIYRTTEAYYQLLQAVRFQEIAQSAVTTIEAQTRQTRQFLEAGIVGPNELLTAQVELADARERLIRTQANVALARAVLARIIGLPINTAIYPSRIPEGPPPSFALTLEAAQDRAVQQRNDLAALRDQLQAIQAEEQQLWWNTWVPDISAISQYRYTRGEAFVDRNEFFIGGFLNWNVWEWGRQFYQGRAASARTLQARLRLAAAEDQVRLQVKDRYLNLTSARERLDVTRAAVAQARESLRIEQVRFEENIATTVDVLDAQTRLSRALGNLASAQYDAFIALAALREAIGGDVIPTVLPEEALPPEETVPGSSSGETP